MNRLADIFVDDSDDKSVLILQEAIDKAIEIISKNREYEKLIKFAEWVKYQTGDNCDAEDKPVKEDVWAIPWVELKVILDKVCDIHHDKWSMLDGITSMSHIQPAIIKYCSENSIELGDDEKWRDALTRAIAECPYLHKKASTNRVYLYSRDVKSNYVESSNGHQASLSIHG